MGNYDSVLVNSEFVQASRWRTKPFFIDGSDTSNHDLALILSLEDSFIERGINETLESLHIEHTESSLMFRIVALQKHDSQSAKCTLEVLLSNIKCFMV